MKVAQVVCTFPPYKGGIGNAAYYFAHYLQKQGINITTFCPLYKRDFTEEYNEFRNLKVTRIKPIIVKGNAAFTPNLYPKLSGFNIIFFHYPFFGGVELLILRKLLNRDQKIVLYYHMDAIPPKDLLRKIFFHVTNRVQLPIVLRLSNKIIVSSYDYISNSHIADYYLKNKSQFFEIPYGVDQSKFYPLQHENDDFRSVKKLLNYKGDEKIITYVGNIASTHYFKGIDILLEAAAKIKKQAGNIKLCLVGTGNLVENYRDKAENLKLSKQCYMLNEMSDHMLNSIYNLSDVVVLPSVNSAESFGLVLTEAMATGTPVIASSLPGVRQVFDDGQSGLLFKVKDIDDLKQKITMLITNETLRRKMSEEAYKKAQSYNWQEAASKLTMIFNEIIQ